MRLALATAGIGLAMVTAAPAVADPPPPPPDPSLIVPAPDAPPAAPAPDPLSAVAQQTKSNPLGVFADLLAGAPGGPQLTPTVIQAGPPVDPLGSIALLSPENFGMPTGDQASPYVLDGAVTSPFARIDAYQGVHALLHGSLGRMSRDQLGQPLPGTAPPPGTALPPGLVQYYQDPAALPPPPAPELPLPAFIPPPVIPPPA
ncbi:MAG: hypothetical protein ACR2JM_03950 [Mycobacterium sp.]